MCNDYEFLQNFAWNCNYIKFRSSILYITSVLIAYAYIIIVYNNLNKEKN